MILITGGTGLSGGPIVEVVAKTGQPLRVMARTPAKAVEAKALGAQIVQGDFGDQASLERCCAGVERVLLNSGSTPDLAALQTNLINAAKRAGVKHIVKFSVWGADHPNAASVRFMKQHAEVEQVLIKSGLAWTMLRPTFFMQNLLGSAATIKSQGAIYMPASDGKAPYVDTRDIADVAATALTKSGHEGKFYPITGPENLTFHDMARLIGEATGKPIKYVSVSDEQARQSLLAAGVPAWSVEGVLELMRATREGWMAGVSRAAPEVTGKPARAFAAFAKENKTAFGA